MADLFAGINIASDAMNAYGKKLAIAGNNMLHSSDPAYSKQTVTLRSRGSYMGSYGLMGLGVEVGDVTSARDAVLDDAVMKARMSTSGLETSYMFLKNIEAYMEGDLSGLGNLQDTTYFAGFGSSLDGMLNAFHELMSSPNDSVAKNGVYNSADTLVKNMKMFSDQYNNIDQSIVNKVNSGIASLNPILDRVGNYLGQIQYMEGTYGTKDLETRDLLQQTLEDLGGIINVQVRDHPVLPNTKQVYTYDTSGNEVLLVDHNKVLNYVSFDGTDVRANGTSTAVLKLTGGSLYGCDKVRKGTLTRLIGEFDSLAKQLVTSVNAAYNPGGTSTDFFKATGLTAGTMALDSTLTYTNVRATATGQLGANEIAEALVDVGKQVFSTAGGDFIDGTISEWYTGMVVGVGEDVSLTRQHMQLEEANEESLRQRRMGIMSVSLDEEVSDLMAADYAMKAIGRYIKAAAELLDMITGII